MANSTILSDAAVGLRGNLLWDPESEVMQCAREFAETIVGTDGALTIAVYGAWGSGKTSFLKIVQDLVNEKKGDQAIDFCWYRASTHQEKADPWPTLSLRILNTLGGEDIKEAARTFQAFFEEVMGPSSADWLKGTLEGSPRPYEWMQQLANRMARLIDFDVLLGEFLAGRGPAGGTPRRLVLVIDDLDRCEPEPILGLLDAAQRLGAVPNLFIFIAVARDVLMSAFAERYKDAEEVQWAVEKYLQYAFELPPITPELLTNYMRKTLQAEAAQSEDPAVSVIIEELDYLTVGLRRNTPRTLKRTINVIRPALRSQLGPSDGETRRVIKERILSYHWPEFFRKYLKPAFEDRLSIEREIVKELERVCVTHYSIEMTELSPERQQENRAVFDVKLDRARARWSLEESDLKVPEEMAKLLAREPFWFYGRGIEEVGVGGLLRPESKVDVPGLDLTERFTQLYIQSERADAIGDGRTSAAAAREAYKLVSRNKKRFGSTVASQLGNLGVNAERYKILDLAERIWRLALELDPEHSSIMQQFASYIIDNRPDLYSEAEEVLKGLQTGRHAEHKPWRTLSLLVQLKAALGQEVDEALTARMAKAAETETDVRQLGAILDGLIDAGGQFQLGAQLFASTVERFPRKSRYTLQRMVADALARRSEIECEFIAMDLYRQILANPETIDAGDEPSVMANYATLLYKHDYDDEAGCLWFKAYQFPAGRGSSGIRRAYSMYLLRADRGDLAQKVIGGEPIDEMVLIPTEKELPERFSDVELPDALSESGKSPLFRCVEQSDSGI